MKRQIKHLPDIFITDSGEVQAVRGRHVYPQTLGEDGYNYVTVNESTFRVDELVLTAFTGNNPGYRPAHVDGNTQNDNLGNLEWVEDAGFQGLVADPPDPAGEIVTEPLGVSLFIGEFPVDRMPDLTEESVNSIAAAVGVPSELFEEKPHFTPEGPGSHVAPEQVEKLVENAIDFPDNPKPSDVFLHQESQRAFMFTSEGWEELDDGELAFVFPGKGESVDEPDSTELVSALEGWAEDVMDSNPNITIKVGKNLTEVEPPADPPRGAMFWDTTGDVLYCYTGQAWETVPEDYYDLDDSGVITWIKESDLDQVFKVGGGFKVDDGIIYKGVDGEWVEYEPETISDDLTRIKGIGKVAEEVLNAAGIWNFYDVARMPVEELRGIFRDAGKRPPGNVQEWEKLAFALMEADDNA